jgi:hypothetical protein
MQQASPMIPKRKLEAAKEIIDLDQTAPLPLFMHGW